jgi:nicotinamidase-related amidase
VGVYVNEPAGTSSNPASTAVLFVECQRGVIGDRTVLPALAESARPALAAMGRLADGARRAGATVVHLTYLPLAGGRSASRRAPLMRRTSSAADWSASDDALEIVPQIGVGPADLVLPRHQGISPVYRTEVLTVLRNMAVTDVVVAGVSTNLAILLVAVGAADEDLAVTIPTDATVGTPPEHHASVLRHSLAFVGRLTTVDELLASWSPDAGPQDAGPSDA